MKAAAPLLAAALLVACRNPEIRYAANPPVEPNAPRYPLDVSVYELFPIPSEEDYSEGPTYSMIYGRRDWPSVNGTLVSKALAAELEASGLFRSVARRAFLEDPPKDDLVLRGRMTRATATLGRDHPHYHIRFELEARLRRRGPSGDWDSEVLKKTYTLRATRHRRALPEAEVAAMLRAMLGEAARDLAAAFDKLPEFRDRRGGS